MSYESVVQSDSPILYWRFQESALPFVDENQSLSLVSVGVSSGGKIDPTKISPTGILTDTSDEAMHFVLTPDANETLIYVGTDIPALDLSTTQKISFEFWIRPGNNSIGPYFVIVGGEYFFFNLTTGGGGACGIRQFIEHFVLPTGTFPQGVWKHVVYTRDSDNTAKLYLNGELFTSGVHDEPLNTYFSTLSISASDNYYGEGVFEMAVGDVDEIAVYNHVLTPARVLAHYNAAVGTVAPPEPPVDPDSPYKLHILGHTPRIYYRMNEPEGSTTIFDSSGNSRHGSCIGSLQYQQTSIILNDTGTSIFFDGTNGFIGFNPAYVNTLDEVSVECWIVWNSTNVDQRIFDFNNGVTGPSDGKYFFCSTKHNTSFKCRAGVTEAGLNGDQFVDGIELEQGQKYHIVTTLGAGKIQLFINGIKQGELATNLKLSDLGIGSAWISKSPWAVDTYYRGLKDEFAVYGRILTQEEILSHYVVGLALGNELEKTISDTLTFTQTFTPEKVTVGAGRIFNMSMSDTLNFSEGLGKSPNKETLKDTLFFTDSVQQTIQPYRRATQDNLIFTEKLNHGLYKMALADFLSFIETFRPHWHQQTIEDALNFLETMKDQLNHQYLTDLLAFVDSYGERYGTRNVPYQDQISWIENFAPRFSYKNITMTDQLAWAESFNRTYDRALSDTLVWTEEMFRVLPFEDQLVWTETFTIDSTKGWSDVLHFLEVWCVQGSLNRGYVDALTLTDYFNFLINGPDDPRNGGSPIGPGGGFDFSTTYRKRWMDVIDFKETYVSDPAPSSKDCVVEMN